MTYLATTLYMNRLYQEQRPKIALAEEGGFIDSAISGIKDYVSGLWDAKRPLASVVGFIGPGLLFKLGFPWLSIAYEVAGALGFDWIGFWDSIKNSVVEIFSGAMKGQKPTQEELHSKLVEETDENLAAHIHDKVDEEKLAELHKKSQGAEMPKTSGIKSISYLIKQAGIFGAAAKSRGLLSTLFRKIIPFALTTLAESLGFATAGGAVRGVAGVKSDKDSPNSETSTEPQAATTRDLINQLKISPNADPDLFEFNKNDPSSVWIENGNIGNIQNVLSSWIFSAYPQLSNEKYKIINSPTFIQVENMFKNRNKMGQALQIYSVPKPFQKKIEIVSYIINSYLKSRGN